MPAPRPERRAHVHTEHGVRREDPYAWLRDREDPAVIAHLEAENAWCDETLAGTKRLQETLYDELLGRVQETDSGAEIPWGPFQYYSRTEAGRAYAIHCRRPRGGGPEQVLFDENAAAEGHDYFSLGVFAVSPDHRRVAYAVDVTGAEKYRLRVLDLASGAHLALDLDGVKANAVWASDSETLVFTVPDEADRPWQAWRVAVTDPAPALVLQEDDARFYVSVSRTRSGAWLVFELGSHSTTEVHVLSASDPAGPVRRVNARKDEVEVSLTHQPGRFLLRTNDGAVNFQVLAVPELDLSATPTVVVPHDPAVFLARVDAFATHLVLSLRRDGLPLLRVVPSEGAAYEIDAPEPTYDLSAAANREFETRHFNYGYTSLVTPASTVAYDVVDRTRQVLKVQPVPGYDASTVVTERLWATAPDGVRVPMSLLRRRDAVPNGDNPCYLVGYGSYGILYDPAFRSSVLSLIERGFVFGIAHIRGGGELGRAWYEDGKFANKPHTFSDFIACAEHLVASRWTQPSRLIVQGGSAGGLLIGAVLNARPDLFGAAIARVPFVDIVSTMLDETLPLTVIEYDEWGNPNEREVFDRMLAYSPYDNVAAKPYPALLVTAGLNDPRVGYWEPAKWVARLRDHTTSDAPIAMRVHMGAGHAGQSGRYGRLREVAMLYAFALTRVGRAGPTA